MAHSHSHDAGIDHSHDDPFNGHGHSHDILDGPGSYVNREMPLIEGRDWKDRAFTIGIGGYVAIPFPAINLYFTHFMAMHTRSNHHIYMHSQ